MSEKWSLGEDNETSEQFIVSPDGDHKFYFGDLEYVDKCCFDVANFVVTACNEFEAMKAVIEAAKNYSHYEYTGKDDFENNAELQNAIYAAVRALEETEKDNG
jgi:hypothetical protein